MHWRIAAAAAAMTLLGACGESDAVSGHDQFVSYVSNHPIGQGDDHWIEMRNNAGEWERVGLIFGYLEDYGECVNAIAGLKKVNYARTYRCVPANVAKK